VGCIVPVESHVQDAATEEENNNAPKIKVFLIYGIAFIYFTLIN
jgi:hypothetical protein